jgi:hypothetical protein
MIIKQGRAPAESSSSSFVVFGVFQNQIASFMKNHGIGPKEMKPGNIPEKVK